ncbi:MAG TPA: hypothetical protein VKA50_01920 [Gammaproteobacteria bacterium]|nr:hypothetical protein [Gammaproteobacteria bacterium]
MKTVGLVALMLGFLVGCASNGGGSLEPGGYYVTSYDAAGAKAGGPARIDIPYNDPNFAIGAMCTNEDAVRVLITRPNGQTAAAFKCVRETRKVGGVSTTEVRPVRIKSE